MPVSPEFMTVVSLCSGLVAVWNLIKIAKTPLDTVKKNADEIAELKKQNKKQGEIDKAILNGLQAITNHMIDGNGIEKLKSSRDELQRAINEIATK